MPDEDSNNLQAFLLGSGRERQDPEPSGCMTLKVPAEFQQTDPAPSGIVDDPFEQCVYVCQGSNHQQSCLQHDEKLNRGHAVYSGEAQVALP